MYSIDFIIMVLKSYNKRKQLNMTVNEIAIFYEISKQTMYNWLKGKYKISEMNKRVYAKVTPKCDSKYTKYVIKFIKSNQQFNMKISLQNLMALFGIGITKQTIYNILKRNKITHKIIQINKYPHSKVRYKKEVNKLRKSLNCRKNRIISIDETAIHINAIGRYGWAKSGTKCIINKPHKNKGVRFSLLFGISKKSIVGYTIKEGTMKGTDFNEFMERIDRPNGNYKYLLDNAVIHHSKLIKKDIKEKMIYNVPYSPQYNPIEYVNNELKRQIRCENIRNDDELRKYMEKFTRANKRKGNEKYFEKAYKMLGI